MYIHSARYKPQIPSLPLIKNNNEIAPRRKHGIQNINHEEIQIKPKLNPFPSTNPRFRKNIPKSSRVTNINLSPIIKNGPIGPQDAIQNFSPLLTNYEKTEINNFPEIYFLGNRNLKTEPSSSQKNNFGFDDNSHNYRVIIGDHLAYRFEILSIIGAGAFGEVLRCIDHKNQNKVAVKVIVNTDQMQEQGKIEAKILARLNKLDQVHIVQAFDFFIFRSHICITFEVLGKNLYELSQSNGFKPLSIKLIRNYSKQVLLGLQTCHQNNIIHCDLKPENILVTYENKSNIKIIDFGSSCFDGYQKYEYIQSRFYRAPEVMIGIKYGSPMDIWSFALIIVELLIGKPLFPGENELDQLSLITELLGPVPTNLVKKGKRKKEFFDDNFNLKSPRNLKYRKPSSLNLKDLIGINDPLLLDLLNKCFTWDQSIRITANEALNHPWFNKTEIIILNKNFGNLPELK